MHLRPGDDARRAGSLDEGFRNIGPLCIARQDDFDVWIFGGEGLEDTGEGVWIANGGHGEMSLVMLWEQECRWMSKKGPVALYIPLDPRVIIEIPASNHPGLDSLMWIYSALVS